jgi:alkaline phosphatase D
MNRREFLAVMAAAGITACSSSGSKFSNPAGVVDGAVTTLPRDPFALGVASGDPTSESVILWTRLVGDGIPIDPVRVGWVVARDHLFSEVVASGDATADPRFAHSVHVDASGLEPDSWYWYRFIVGEWRSVPARTRTAPAAGTMPSRGRVRVGFGSCQNWEDGYYTAHPHLAEEDIDLVLFLGDYIYEGGIGDSGVRRHDAAEPTDLAGYRGRYALYKSDTGLQASHASCPWVVTWDDHEVENDYTSALSETRAPEDQFLERRAAAYQAFYEHMPVRIDPPDGPDALLYRSVPWGDLAQFLVLDGRQYRSDQPCTAQTNFSFAEACDEVNAPANTMLGAGQRNWLVDGLATSGVVWDVLANQTVMTPMPLGALNNFDQWDGYPVERTAVLGAAANAGSNLVALSGDFHTFMVGDLVTEPGGPVVGTEFVGGSITSSFPVEFGDVITQEVDKLPQFHFVDPANHGYGVLELTPDLCRCDYRAVTGTQTADADIRTIGSWTVKPGQPGARPG